MKQLGPWICCVFHANCVLKPVIASYVSWLAQNGVPTPLFCELHRWPCAAECAAAARCRSNHIKKLDVALSDTLRIISCGCVKPTRKELLPVLSGIPPAHLRREHSSFKLALQAQLNTNHPLHTLVHSAQFLGTQRLHSRRPFRRNALALVNSGFNLLESWRAAWESATPPAQF